MFRFAPSLRLAFTRCGSSVTELSAVEAAKYARPAAAADGAAALAKPSNERVTGPVLDCTLCGVVRNTAVGPADDSPVLRCDVVATSVSPSRGPLSEWVVDKQIFRVAVRGKYAAQQCTVFRDGAVVYCHGRLLLKPIFDANSFSYQYTPEVVVSDEYGWAQCVMRETAAVPNRGGGGASRGSSSAA